ncbi:MAG: metallophosphoesterase [Thermoanaerobaculia bacterium]|nr:metallophosphoesterase [Thermoanaerobaculia bacterium]
MVPDAPPPHRRELAFPQVVEAHRRAFFHPRRGWFRSLEREISNALSRSVYPRIPLLRRVYDRQLGRTLRLTRVEVPIRDLPEPFDGVTLLLLCDFHAGPFVSPPAMRLALRRLLAGRPDLILLGGDFVTSSLAELVDARAMLTDLAAPLGVFGVLGNHDHYTEDGDEVRRVVEACGVDVLHNRAVRLRRGGADLWLAGVDDMNAGRPDLAAALAAASAPAILLSHNPDFFFDAADAGVALTLSGHTHGGQIKIPGRGVIVRQSRYHLDEGWYRHDGAQLVVSRGLGVTGVPLRVGSAPEGVWVRLVRAGDARRPDGVA